MKELYHFGYATATKRVAGPHSDITNTENIWGDCTRMLGSARNLTGNISGLNGTVTGLNGDATGSRLYMFTYIYFGDITNLSNEYSLKSTTLVEVSK
jgi:hypothetical protein